MTAVQSNLATLGLALIALVLLVAGVVLVGAVRSRWSGLGEILREGGTRTWL